MINEEEQPSQPPEKDEGLGAPRGRRDPEGEGVDLLTKRNEAAKGKEKEYEESVAQLRKLESELMQMLAPFKGEAVDSRYKSEGATDVYNEVSDILKDVQEIIKRVENSRWGKGEKEYLAHTRALTLKIGLVLTAVVGPLAYALSRDPGLTAAASGVALGAGWRGVDFINYAYQAMHVEPNLEEVISNRLKKTPGAIQEYKNRLDKVRSGRL